MTSHRHLLSSIAAVLVVLIISGWMTAEEEAVDDSFTAERPNVLIIMADDMGYSDIGSYGGEIDTPVLDRLAAGGLQFTDFYTNNMCVPTRAALLTGVHHDRSYDGSLADRVVTIAEVLEQSGYHTFMSGKWHLAPWSETNNDKEDWPLQRGFDRFFGTILGAGSFFAPNSLTRGNRSAADEYLREDFYYTDAIGTNAVEYIREAGVSEAPFFGYVAFTAPHWPLHARPEDIAKYEGVYVDGWDAMRKRRFERMMELGIIDDEWELSPRHSKVQSWPEVSEFEKRWQMRRMEVYAAQIDRMDRNIGRVLEALHETDRYENTLIFFLSDNGGCHVELPPSRRGPFLPDTTREGRPVRNGNLLHITPGAEDTYQSYGYGWANLSNTPFRLFKQFDHEGGIRTPLIIHWPNGVKEPGRMVRELGHNVDVMATILDVLQVSYPETFLGQRLHPLDGRSLLPAIAGDSLPVRDPLIWEWARGKAVRHGAWKLVSRDDQPWELYNIEGDPTELHDRSSEQLGHVDRLEQLWVEWRLRQEEQ